jgi:hypothetical protein
MPVLVLVLAPLLAPVIMPPWPPVPVPVLAAVVIPPWPPDPALVPLDWVPTDVVPLDWVPPPEAVPLDWVPLDWVPLAALGLEPQPAERTVPGGSANARTKSTRLWNFIGFPFRAGEAAREVKSGTRSNMRRLERYGAGRTISDSTPVSIADEVVISRPPGVHLAFTWRCDPLGHPPQGRLRLRTGTCPLVGPEALHRGRAAMGMGTSSEGVKRPSSNGNETRVK